MDNLQIQNVFILASSILLFFSLAIGINLVLVCAKLKDISKKELEVMISSLTLLLTLFYGIRCYM